MKIGNLQYQQVFDLSNTYRIPRTSYLALLILYVAQRTFLP